MSGDLRHVRDEHGRLRRSRRRARRRPSRAGSSTRSSGATSTGSGARPDKSVISPFVNRDDRTQTQRRGDRRKRPNHAVRGDRDSDLDHPQHHWALLHHPGQLAAVKGRPDLFAAAVNETLRWIPPVGYSERWAAADTELAGIDPSGRDDDPDITSANRDPSFFADPDRFDIHRANARHHTSFSHGQHHCIGFNVANLEARIAVQRLFERFGGLELDPGPAGGARRLRVPEPARAARPVVADERAVDLSQRRRTTAACWPPRPAACASRSPTSAATSTASPTRAPTRSARSPRRGTSRASRG